MGGIPREHADAALARTRIPRLRDPVPAAPAGDDLGFCDTGAAAGQPVLRGPGVDRSRAVLRAPADDAHPAAGPGVAKRGL